MKRTDKLKFMQLLSSLYQNEEVPTELKRTLSENLNSDVPTLKATLKKISPKTQIGQTFKSQLFEILDR